MANSKYTLDLGLANRRATQGSVGWDDEEFKRRLRIASVRGRLKILKRNWGNVRAFRKEVLIDRIHKRIEALYERQKRIRQRFLLEGRDFRDDSEYVDNNFNIQKLWQKLKQKESNYLQWLKDWNA